MFTNICFINDFLYGTQSDKSLCVHFFLQGQPHILLRQLTFNNIQYCTVGWSDFSFLWNFEKKQVGVVTFGKKTCFH